MIDGNVVSPLVRSLSLFTRTDYKQINTCLKFITWFEILNRRKDKKKAILQLIVHYVYIYIYF